MSIEETIRRRWEKFEPMRIRIMQEAYDCADRNEFEAYNSIKVMCSEVLRLAEEMVLAEREACAKVAMTISEQGLPKEIPEGDELLRACEQIASGVLIADAIRARGQE